MFNTCIKNTMTQEKHIENRSTEKLVPASMYPYGQKSLELPVFGERNII